MCAGVFRRLHGHQPRSHVAQSEPAHMEHRAGDVEPGFSDAVDGGCDCASAVSEEATHDTLREEQSFSEEARDGSQISDYAGRPAI